MKNLVLIHNIGIFLMIFNKNLLIYDIIVSMVWSSILCPNFHGYKKCVCAEICTSGAIFSVSYTHRI